ncbi:hypothetical protein PTSG_13108 [Salpingoeca rosetta]|uniref:Uncharacterized protein n=1 Tax=Salpingoeca rosetta (strain ATCC 50818 / BSB-021) TaxID=946362 RepID=F2URK4_SALR5|nr:uncharacterized protein PTSG_13108 [Salpingoeca rosetta]EGD80173.1 hypothetical protein PTSG_13108 [Salpingoeca rosetta]|eukprot:XP_004988235.1 hypothetical protein PTSG_13108 [Salpingoeca rosetta]
MRVCTGCVFDRGGVRTMALLCVSLVAVVFKWLVFAMVVGMMDSCPRALCVGVVSVHPSPLVCALAHRGTQPHNTTYPSAPSLYLYRLCFFYPHHACRPNMHTHACTATATIPGGSTLCPSVSLSLSPSPLPFQLLAHVSSSARSFIMRLLFFCLFLACLACATFSLWLHWFPLVCLSQSQTHGHTHTHTHTQTHGLCVS